MPLIAPFKTVRRARKQRRAMSLPEVLLWQELRQRPGGYKFRHQHPIQGLTLDFACLSSRLCVEAEGESHNRGDQPGFDGKRDEQLALLGFVTLRIPNELILRDLASAITAIVKACAERGPPPPSLRDGPPPRSGEDREPT